MDRELDVRIAEFIFGIKVKTLHQKHGWRIDYVAENNSCNDAIVAMDMIDGYKLKYFSSDLDSAMLVMDKLQNEWNYISIDNAGGLWTIRLPDGTNVTENSFPKTICLAAIISKKAEELENELPTNRR